MGGYSTLSIIADNGNRNGRRLVVIDNIKIILRKFASESYQLVYMYIIYLSVVVKYG